MLSMIARVFQGAKAEGIRSHFLFSQVAQNGKKTCHHCNRNPQRRKCTGTSSSVSSGPAESKSTKFNQVAERKQTAPTERINLGSLKLRGQRQKSNTPKISSYSTANVSKILFQWILQGVIKVTL